MRIAPLSDVKARLSAYVEHCEAEGPIVITRNGKAVAVLLAPYDEEDLEHLVLARTARFQALLDKSRQSLKQGEGLSRDAFWKAVQERSREQEPTQTTRKRRTAKKRLTERAG